MSEDDARIVEATRAWLERAVIGLRLCPFAETTYRRQQIRYQVSAADTTAGLLEDLAHELQHLRAAEPALCETTLLIHPRVLASFDDYNQFLDDADATVRELGLEGEIQVASFHPAYQFAGTEPDDVENYTNRSPYPMLHLLREASVARAVEAYPGVEEIGSRNVETLRELGLEGWRELWSSEATAAQR